ncbi:UDP-glycosyltransferase UGT5-like [Bacillus rossius redtenbacheri]|uniref:UDP-glycosyltransferase UGT5-like n=1 Tax=Bacillus rossius redtenbacheri TaxID=93214 RepID=UPI002FDD641A
MILKGVFCLLVVQQGCAESYRILGVFPARSRSHFLMTGALMRGLAARGHRVVVVSPFPQSPPPPRYQDVSLPAAPGSVPVEAVARSSPLPSLQELRAWGVDACEDTLSAPPVRELLASGARFHLVVAEAFNADCLYALAHKLGAPLVGVSTCTLMPWAGGPLANPDNPSYIPAHFLPLPPRMSFLQRLANSATLLLARAWHGVFLRRDADSIARRHLGQSLPGARELARGMSLLLVNSHFSLHQPRPLVPAVVEVGGLHLQAPRNLSEEFSAFLDESVEGVIYFCLGSRVRSDSFSEEKRQGFMEAFSELPLKVLWKWESDFMPGKPKNVKIAKWMPQLEILSHPNVKVFITHGGSMGTMEAAYFGVPMVAIPLFGDQPLNVQYYIDKGIAVKLDYATINKHTVTNALKTVLNNKSYAESARRVAQLFRDRPMSPLDTAVYWTEYVIRHEGARHLRSAAADLQWYQLWLLDVAACLLSLAAAAALAVAFLARRCRPSPQ